MIRLTFASRFAPRGRAARVLILALATAPWLFAACGDDAQDDDTDGGAEAGSGGTTAGTGGSAGSGGTGGSAGGSATAGSAGSGNLAGSSGSASLADAGTEPGEADASTGAFTLSSPAFDDVPECGPDDRAACDLFPDENISLGDAADVSPAINWTTGPAGTQSYAIALHDLTFSISDDDPYTHWVMWNIPPSATGLPAELPSGADPGPPAPVGSQQVSIRNDLGYTGSGACGNVYEFTLYALGTPAFDPSDDSDPDAVQADLEASDDVLGKATMRARSDPAGPTCD